MTNPVTYTAFGERRSGAPASPFGFTGGLNALTDTDSGLILLGHRYYQGDIGRFLSPDPARSGDNWYDYCENDPVNSIDPLGLEERKLKGNEKQLVQSAINMLRQLGYEEAAERLQYLLDHGLILVDDGMSENAKTRWSPEMLFISLRGGIFWIDLKPEMLKDMTVARFFELVSTLYHEWKGHIMDPEWGDPNTPEDYMDEIQAYNAEERFLLRWLERLEKYGGTPEQIDAIRKLIGQVRRIRKSFEDMLEGTRRKRH